jgi:hypothetical protein
VIPPRLLLPAVVVALAFCAPAAGATTRSGAGTDPAGDSAAGPTQDITNVEAAYDDAGSVTATVTLAADPAGAPNFVFVAVGTATGGGCGSPAIVLGAYSNQTQGIWGLDSDDASDYEAAAVTAAGPKLTIAASSSRIAGEAYNCVTATVSPQGSNQPTSDQLDAPAALTAPPVTTTPPPAPTPTTPAPAPAPAPAAAPAPVKQTVAAAAPKPKVAQLAVTVTGVPKTIKRSKWMALKVRVANTGTAAALSVKLTIASARGLSVKPKTKTITLKTLRAGKATTRTVKLALTKRARRTTTVLFTAKGARKVSARGRLALTIGRAKAIKRPAPVRPGATTPARPTSPLAGTYWWYTINHVDWSWDNHGVYFVDDNWAYRGIPKGGLPTCTTQTAGTDDKGNETDGCIPYTYDAASGNVTLGTAAGTFRDGRLQITDEADVQDYSRLIVPDAGSRYTVDLTHRWFQGMCGLILGCTTGQQSLQLLPDGQFVNNHSTISTMGDPGSGPFTYVGSYPPDQHGTYDVQAGGKIHLAFADGTAKDYTFAIQTNDAGQPDPATEGVMLDDDNYYKQTD